MSIRKPDSRKREGHRFEFQRLEPKQLLATLAGAASECIATDVLTEFPVQTEVSVAPTPTLANSNSGSGVVGRYVFYNDSAFDGNDTAANADDDNAIATDKVALLPGQTATFANYTSFDEGINGIIIDAPLADPLNFSANDIDLRTGTGNELGDFERLTRLDVLADVSVRVGEGVGGSDRITIILPNDSVANEFLQVTVIANQTTGLNSNDVFYFGNATAETGNASNSLVDTLDIARVRNNQSGFFAVGIDNPYDFNRDLFVDTIDIARVRNSQTGFLPVPLITAPVPGDDFFVTSAADIDDIIDQVGPGDTITLQDGFWTNQQISFTGVGTADRPITLRAQTPGQVILNGSSSLNISGDYLVADGLNFSGGALGEGDHVVEFRGDLGEATNSRLTNSAITDYNPNDINTRYFWVSLYGQNNRVDHNSFSNQNHSGVTVTVWRNSNDPDFHLIDNNYFADRPEGNSNGWESIRVGTSDYSLSDSFTTVESNLFERTDGEIEIISNKSGSNIFRNNTFRESSGTLTLRHGDNNVVEGNYFIGEGKDGSGGVRIIGENQTVVNNYFEGLDGRADGAISISAGVPNPELYEHFLVRNAVIAHNTIVNVNGASITFDQGLGSRDRTLLAENITIANNLISSTLDPLFEGAEGSGWVWEGNIAFGESLGPKAGDSGITVVDPQLVLGADGIFRLDAGSAAIDAGSGDYSSFVAGVDIEGQLRDGQYDIGADEFSTETVTRGALVANNIGHYWAAGNGGSSPSLCSDGCLSVLATDFTSTLDPNGDGDTFTVETASDALGGETLIAPAGNRADASDQDAVVTYNLDFADTGTYTVYVRARGFDGGTNSIYVPSDFGVNPAVNETLSNDGVYRWEKLEVTFDVNSGDIGDSLEFSIGKRERGADFNAFVFHLDDSLSDSELDSLFS